MRDRIDIYEIADLGKLERIISILHRKGKKIIKDGINDTTFNNLINFFIFILSYYNIDKNYNSTVIPNEKVVVSERVAQLLLSVSAAEFSPLRFNRQGGTCFDWCILFSDILSSINESSGMNIKVIRFEGSLHTMNLISFNNTYYILDIFDKRRRYGYMLEEGSMIYLGERDGKQEYAIVESIDPLTFSLLGELINYQVMDTDELIGSINTTTFGDTIKVKTAYEGEYCRLDIDIHSRASGSYTVEFDDVVTYGNLLVLYDLVKNTTSSYDFLLGVIEYTAPELPDLGKSKLMHVAKKIDLDYLKKFFFGSKSQ